MASDEPKPISERKSAYINGPCEVCGEDATTFDGIVGAIICDSARCLDVVWTKAWATEEPK